MYFKITYKIGEIVQGLKYLPCKVDDSYLLPGTSYDPRTTEVTLEHRVKRQAWAFCSPKTKKEEGKKSIPLFSTELSSHFIKIVYRDKVFAFYAAKPGSFPSTKYGSLIIAKSDCQE